MDVARFKALPVMGILRGGNPDLVPDLVETAVTAGLETLEIAMNTPGAVRMIERAREAAGERLMIGAGTVLTLERMTSALAAGATFIVLPNLVPEVVGRCRDQGIPVFPGALTPHEIYAAWSAGASMVKVFPAKFFGPEYFREIKGPFEDVELLACGGVSPDNVASFVASGASAVAFGGSVFKPAWLAAREFGKVEQGIRAFVNAYRAIGS